MTKKYHDTEYLYLSACIHSWETRLLTPERREQLLSAPTDRDAARVLEEMGWPAFDPESEAALDQAVGRRREELFARLGKDMPDARILDVFRLPTDYHNLKVLVKSRGEDCRRLLMAGGRWDPEQLLSDYRQRELRDFLPAETAQAVQQARQALAETGNGQACDLVLDGTCFRELTRLADAVDCPALTDYLRTRIDGVNLCSAVRAHRLRKGPDFLHRVLLEGGSVPPAALEEAAPADLRELYAATPLREAAGLAEGICAGGGSMTALEKQCDNAVLRLAAKARRTPFGVETALGYLIAAEAELTAVRTIMTGRRRDYPPTLSGKGCVIFMAKIAVIGDRDSVLGFRALGLEVHTVEDSTQARHLLRKAAEEGCAAVFLTEALAAPLQEEIDRYKEALTPAIVLIPGQGWFPWAGGDCAAQRRGACRGRRHHLKGA